MKTVNGDNMTTKKIMILSGGFDPIHSGHIEMFSTAKTLGYDVAVCVNSDAWLIKKKGYNFLDVKERVAILSALECVDYVFEFEDDEHGSAINGIKKVVEHFASNPQIKFASFIGDDTKPYEYQFFFGNGGDRNPSSTPSLEQKYCEKNNIELIWGLGGEKTNSSSWIINRFKNSHFEMDERHWGNYKVLYQDTHKKVKVLEIMPGKAISLQKHLHRSETWIVVEGVATVYLEKPNEKIEKTIGENESVFVPIGAIHKLSNKTDQILQLVEVQIGDYLGEDDIIRLDI